MHYDCHATRLPHRAAIMWLWGGRLFACLFADHEMCAEQCKQKWVAWQCKIYVWQVLPTEHDSMRRDSVGVGNLKSEVLWLSTFGDPTIFRGSVETPQNKTSWNDMHQFPLIQSNCIAILWAESWVRNHSEPRRHHLTGYKTQNGRQILNIMMIYISGTVETTWLDDLELLWNNCPPQNLRFMWYDWCFDMEYTSTAICC